jgi:hypothetical protein
LEKIELNNKEKDIEFEKSKLREELTSKLSEKVKYESQLEVI